MAKNSYTSVIDGGGSISGIGGSRKEKNQNNEGRWMTSPVIEGISQRKF